MGGSGFKAWGLEVELSKFETLEEPCKRPNN